MNNYKYINLEYLELMNEGDLEMTNIILNLLINEIPTELTKMTEALESNNWDEMFSLSHKMKSTLSYVGNESMIEANKQIEHSTRHKQNYDLIPDKMNTLNSLCSKVVEELNEAKHALHM
jgi:HPt (histidine-containing phosphotransfer) domain-containing protein